MVMGALFGSLFTIIIAATIVNNHESGIMTLLKYEDYSVPAIVDSDSDGNGSMVEPEQPMSNMKVM